MEKFIKFLKDYARIVFWMSFWHIIFSWDRLSDIYNWIYLFVISIPFVFLVRFIDKKCFGIHTYSDWEFSGMSGKYDKIYTKKCKKCGKIKTKYE